MAPNRDCVPENVQGEVGLKVPLLVIPPWKVFTEVLLGLKVPVNENAPVKVLVPVLLPSLNVPAIAVAPETVRMD